MLIDICTKYLNKGIYHIHNLRIIGNDLGTGWYRTDVLKLLLLWLQKKNYTGLIRQTWDFTEYEDLNATRIRYEHRVEMLLALSGLL